MASDEDKEAEKGQQGVEKGGSTGEGERGGLEARGCGIGALEREGGRRGREEGDTRVRGTTGAGERKKGRQDARTSLAARKNRSAADSSHPRRHQRDGLGSSEVVIRGGGGRRGGRVVAAGGRGAESGWRSVLDVVGGQ
ncbi:hypothetical protein Tco_0585291 [Tanacetum coccineum]